MTVRCGIVEESYFFEEILPESEDNKRRYKRESKEDSDAREECKGVHKQKILDGSLVGMSIYFSLLFAK